MAGPASEEMPSFDMRQERTPEEWAQIAAQKAVLAANHALAAHQSIGHLTRDISDLREEMRQGFATLHGKVKRTQRSLHDIQEQAEDDPADNTQVRNLKAQLRAVDKRKEFWAKLAGTALAGGIAVALGALLLRWLHL